MILRISGLLLTKSIISRIVNIITDLCNHAKIDILDISAFGFGLAGIFGLALTIGSLMLLMLDNDVFDFTFVVSKDILNASGSILIAVLGFGLLLFFGGIKFTESQAFKRVMLKDTQDLDKGYISRKYSDKLIGKNGKAMTILRPSGKITISDKIYDATTSGEYIEKNSKIIVLSNEGSTLKVKKS